MKRKSKTILFLLGSVVLLTILCTLFFFFYWLPLEEYNNAKSTEKCFNIYSAVDSYGELISFKDSRKRREDLIKYLFDDNYHIQFHLTARIDDDETVKWKYVDNDSYEEEKDILTTWQSVKDVAFLPLADFQGRFDEVFFALLSSGKVVHTPLKQPAEQKILDKEHMFITRSAEEIFVESEWNDIVKISNSDEHVVGLKADGTVVAAGDNSTAQCKTDGWHDIVDIAAGGGFTAGLKKDGTVVLAIDDYYTTFHWCNNNFEVKRTSPYEFAELLEPVHTWENITKIYADCNHIVGLRKDGTVVAAGQNRFGQLNVEDWEDLVDIRTTEFSTYGLKSDGSFCYTEICEQ